ncbi:MAG TPA: TPM domain-containing protein [Gemmatimonadales bacterium]|nr:TPM domain-containing protein [Gemmatimonadales bacterium]
MSGTRAKAIALLTGLQLAAGALTAQDAGVSSLFPARPTGYVTDAAGIVDEAAEARITDLAERLKATTGAEIAVVTLPTIGDREEVDVAREIGRAWGVGAEAEVGDPRRNAGIVLLLVPRQGGRPGTGRVRIEVGLGLEGIVTDVVAGRIRDLMGDRLASEDYSGALLDGVEALAGIIARGFGVSDTALTNARPAAEPRGTRGTPLGALPILLFIVFLVLSGALGGRGRRRRRRTVFWGGPWIGGGFGGGGGWGGGGFGGGGFGGFGGGGGFSGGGAGGRF